MKEKKIIETALHIYESTDALQKNISVSDIIQALSAIELQHGTDEIVKNTVSMCLNDASLDDIEDYVSDYLSLADIDDIIDVVITESEKAILENRNMSRDTIENIVSEKLRKRSEKLRNYERVYDLVGGKVAAKSMLQDALAS